jgi:hypothetical protein
MRTPIGTQALKKLFADKFGLELDEEHPNELAKAFHEIVNFNDEAAFPVSETRFFEVLFLLLNDVELRTDLDQYFEDCEFHRVACMRAEEEQHS